MDDQPHSSAKKINAMKARQNFGTMLEEVYYRGEQYIIERAGKPMAAVIPLRQLKKLQKLQEPRGKKSAETITARKRQSKKK